jgi:GDP-D-mannose dehydratase
MPTSVITGVTGQDGTYLTQQLLERGHKVYGAFRRTSSINFWRLEELGLLKHPNLELVDCQYSGAFRARSGYCHLAVVRANASSRAAG